MPGYHNMTFGDLGELFDGPHATPKRMDSGPYFLNISSLNAGRLDLDQSDHVSEDDFQHWTRRVTPQENDLLFSYETRLGEAALMPGGVQACLGRRMALMRPNCEVVHPRFLLYYYLSPSFQQLIEQHTIHGATVNRIGLSTMGNWPISIPSLDEQGAIAEVLGALDDKIAANTKLAETCMKLASTVFEGALMTELTELKQLGSFATVVLGGTPSKSKAEYWTNGTIPWLNSGKANEERILEPSTYITEDALNNSAAKLMPSGTTIVAITGATLGQVARLEIEASGNQSLVGIWTNDESANAWLYLAVQSQISELLKRATGAAQQHVNKRDVETLAVPVPSDHVLSSIGAELLTLFASAAENARENRTLAATRDALLPQLMSGKLRVRDIENTMGEMV